MTTKKSAKKSAKKAPRASEANSAKREVLSASELAAAQAAIPRGTKLYGVMRKATDNYRVIRVVFANNEGGISHVWPKLWRVLGRWDEKNEGGRFSGTGFSVIQEAREELASLLYGDAKALKNDSALL